MKLSPNPILVPGVHRYSKRELKKMLAKHRRDRKAKKLDLKTRKNNRKLLIEQKKKLATTKEDKKKLPPQEKKNQEAKSTPVKPEANAIKVPSHVFDGVLSKPTPKKARKSTMNPKKIRSSITPGTILIILSGRYAGKRVINLKALESGMLLVTGPVQINGVPLRRVNQSNVIATSKKIDILSLSSLKEVTDSLFSNTLSHYLKRLQGKGSADLPAKPDKSSPEVQMRIKTQQSIDSELMPLIKKVPNLKLYLKSKFSLTKGQRPHLMRF